MSRFKVTKPKPLPFTEKDDTKQISSFPAKVRFIGESEPGYFIHGRIYEVLGKEEDLYRIIDETGEDYLYPLDEFEFIE